MFELAGIPLRGQGRRHRRRLRRVLGQVGQERGDGVHRVGLGVDHQVRVPGLGGGRGAAELLVGDLLPDRRFDDRGSGQRDGRAAHHHHVVRGGGVQRGVAVARPEHGRGARDHRRSGRRLEEGGEVQGKAGEPPPRDVRHPAAVGVAEQHQGEPVPLGVLDQPPLLAHADRGGRSRDHARVDADHPDPPAVEQAEPGDDRVRRDRLLPTQLGEGERADLEPGVRVDEQVDALPDRETAGLAVPPQTLGSAARTGRLLLLTQDGDPLRHAPCRRGAAPGRRHGTSEPSSYRRASGTLDYQTVDW